MQQFPGLWNWISGQIDVGELKVSRVAMDEVTRKTPECGLWLKDSNLQLLEMSNAILQDARRIKGLL